MNVALAGLMTREAVALDMLVGKSLPGWQCNPVPAGRGVSLPPADLYVVDLAGWGLARWSEAAERHLLEAMGSAPAVLVAPAFDQTWSALDARRIGSQSLVLLHKPYGVEDMRAALKQAAAGRALQAAPAPLPAQPAKPAKPARVRVAAAPVALVAPVIASRVPAPVPVPAAPVVERGEMTASAFQARLGAFPDAVPQLFLRQLADALSLGQPFEIRVTFLHRLIVDPREGWVACNTPASELQGLCQDDARASATEIDPIDDRDAKARALRLDMPVQPLESFLWQLMQGRPEPAPVPFA
jgi:hypothetical protein